MTNDVKTTETPLVAEPETSSEPKQFTKLGEDIGETTPLQPLKSPPPSLASALQMAEDSSGGGQFGKLVTTAKFSQRTWLVGATVFLGLVTLLAFSLMPRRNRVKEKSLESTVESLTPEAAMAGCGQPAEDVTKDLYPMIERTMTFRPSGKPALILMFSRTSEENSQWLFLSMKDENGTIKYETPQTQIAALPCLAPKK